MALKVKKSKLPFVALNTLNEEAARLYKDSSTRIFQQIRTVIMSSDIDPDDYSLITSSLQRSVDAEEYDLELWAHNLRLVYGAPTEARWQLPQRLIDQIIPRLPFEGGKLQSDHSLGFEGVEILTKPYEEIVSQSSIVDIGEVRSDYLIKVLSGAKKTVTLLKHPDQEKYTVLSGGEVIFANEITGVQAQEAIVYKSKKVHYPNQIHSDISWRELAARVDPLTVEETYRAPAYYEPVFSIARKESLDNFANIVRGEVPTHIKELREEALNIDKARSAHWVSIYDKSKKEGYEPEKAVKIALEDEKYKKLEERLLRVLLRVTELEEGFEERRQEFVRALSTTESLIKEYSDFGLKPQVLKGVNLLWEISRRGQREHPVDYFKGLAADAVTLNQKVRLRNSIGEYEEGIVTKIHSPYAWIRTEQGVTRKVSDPTLIYSLDNEKTVYVDNGNHDWVNEDMNSLVIKKFRVRIPSGSQSRKIEAGLVPITDELNSTRLRVNHDTWQKNLSGIQKELETANAELQDAVGDPKFRANSTADCVKFFIEKQNLPPISVSKKTGQPTCDSNVLQAYANMGDRVAPLVSAARVLISKQSQLNAWGKYAKQGDVQAEWNSFGTPMGRYTAQEPNLQNRITEVRETIEAPDGWLFISGDLGQADYVTWASLSGDPTLSKIFMEGEDLHQRMIEEILLEVPDLDLENKDPRKVGKEVNFSELYLMQPFALARKLGTNQDIAKKLMEAWQARAPQAVSYIESFLREARKDGVVSTRFGRTRELPALTASGLSRAARHDVEKTAWHHHNAGTSAELLKLRQVKSWRRIRKSGLDDQEVRMGLQMHDEIIYLAKLEHVDNVKSIVEEAFLEETPGFLPFKVDMRIGKNWLEISK